MGKSFLSNPMRANPKFQPVQGSIPKFAYPGLILGATSKYTAGPGTHLHNGNVVGSVCGRTDTSINSLQQHCISVSRMALPSPVAAIPPSSLRVSTTNVLPSVGLLVLARVTRVRSRQVDVGILCVELQDSNNSFSMHVCGDTYAATIRREDIRLTEKDKIICTDNFRVGDVVRGRVISVGDQANYYLTTAGNELGVMLASSGETGETMVPVSWKQMGLLHGGSDQRENRKVAKPF